MTKQPLCIGVDGGATEVKAHVVQCEDFLRSQHFKLGAVHASRIYQNVDGFSPVAIPTQLEQRDRAALSFYEKQQGLHWIESTADAILEVVANADAGIDLLIGIGMPGLKTADKRGIAVINNGPRMPKFLDTLEETLKRRGTRLIAPIARLGSDADYCGIGEEWADDGAFRNVANAYYVGCGTGVADALKLHGDLVTFDAAKTWIQKAWQLSSRHGSTFEQIVSAKSMNLAYQPNPDFTQGATFPERDALDGKQKAIEHMAKVADALAELIVERIDTIKNGRRATDVRGPIYPSLTVDHPYRNILLDRVVIGQRVGQIYGDERYAAVFGDVLDAAVVRHIKALEDPALSAHVLEGDRVRPGFICASALRAAPALGAAVDAVHAWRSAIR